MAALALIAIVLPAAMAAMSSSTSTASAARKRNEAVELAQEKLSQLIATGQWQGGTLSGDGSPNYPQYQWQAVVQSWVPSNNNDNNSSQITALEEIDLTVTWLEGAHSKSVTLSTLVYPSSQTSGTAAPSSTTGS